MQTDWILLVVIGAAVLHGAWHALIKAGADRLVGLAGMNIVSAGIAWPAVFWLPPLPQSVWPVLAASILLHAIYKLSISVLYSTGDLSQGYPIARGLVPLFATLAAFGLLGEIPSMAQAAGILLISCGLLAMALDGRRVALAPRFWVAAIATALSVAAYSAVDGMGIRASGEPYSYIAWLVALDGSFFVLVAFVMRRGRLFSALRDQAAPILLSGLLGTASFSIFLFALSRAPIGVVSALRETSVLVVTLFGYFMLREDVRRLRLVGAIIIFVGIVICSR